MSVSPPPDSLVQPRPFSPRIRNESPAARTRSRTPQSLNSERGGSSKGGIKKKKFVTDRYCPSSLSRDVHPVQPLTQCDWCRQGGVMLICEVCSIVAVCVYHEVDGVSRCLPRGTTKFTCPDCLLAQGLPIPYSIPPRALGGTGSGANTAPLVLLNVYLDTEQGVEASVQNLNAICRSRYIAQMQNILTLEAKFSDIKSSDTQKLLKSIRLTINHFLSSHSEVRFLLVLTTHASPINGGLLCRLGSSNNMVSLTAFIEEIFGTRQERMDLKCISNALLVVNACGGLVTHHVEELQNSHFHSVFAFGASTVDPLLVMTSFLPVIIEYHIFSKQAVITATERALPNFGYHSSVYLITCGKMYRFRVAPYNYAPNGREDEVRCCGQFPLRKGSKVDGRGHKTMVTFRCVQPEHPAEKQRKFAVKVLADRGTMHWFVNCNMQRFIAEIVE